jgi:hypothetical protein
MTWIRRGSTAIRNKRSNESAKPSNFIHSSFSHNEKTSFTLEDNTFLVGVHPDECNDDILEMALRMSKKVVIVPCYVFPSLSSFGNCTMFDLFSHMMSTFNIC